MKEKTELLFTYVCKICEFICTSVCIQVSWRILLIMNTPGQPLSRHRPCQLLLVEGIFWVVQKLVVGRLQLSPFLCYRSELFVHADAGFIGCFDDISNYHVVKNKPIVNSHFFSFCDLIFFLSIFISIAWSNLQFDVEMVPWH